MQEVPERFRNAVLAGNKTTEITVSVLNTDGTTYAIFENKQIVADSLRLSQAICDDTNLKFGGCIASCLEIELAGIDDLTGRTIKVEAAQRALLGTFPGEDIYPGYTVYPGYTRYTEVFSLFTGRVDSCRLQKNHITRRIIAYDRFAKLATVDCTIWYRSLYESAPNDPITLGALHDAIIQEFNITQALLSTNSSLVRVALPADSFPVYKLTRDGITPLELLRQIGEINGIFMRLNGLGEIEYISPPDPTPGTYSEIYAYYIDAEREDFTHTAYDGLYVPGLGYYGFYGNPGYYENLYVMDNELFSTGYTSQELSQKWGLIRDEVEQNFAAEYTPARLSADARLWVEPGDRVVFGMKWYEQQYVQQQEQIIEHTENVRTLVLSRYITGIAAMQDEFIADGDSELITDSE